MTKVPETSVAKPTKTSSAQLPYASKTRKDCDEYVPGDMFQLDGKKKIWKSSCHFAIEVENVGFDMFKRWNPSKILLLSSDILLIYS